MSDAPIKTYLLRGNLNRGRFFVTPICTESTNISIGLWNLCISSICLDTKDSNGVFCSILCNLVIDKQLNLESKVETSNPPIATIFLKGRKIVYIDKTWFTINNQCSDIKLFFVNLQTQQPPLIDCELYVTVLLQRVK
jgi:hypothetical protein